MRQYIKQEYILPATAGLVFIVVGLFIFVLTRQNTPHKSIPLQEIISIEEQIQPKNEKEIANFDTMLNWTTLAIEELGYITHSSIREDIAKSKVFFTNDGWPKYLQALQEAGIAEHLKQNKATQILRLVDRPKMMNKEDYDSFYKWHIMVPSERLISLANGPVTKLDMDILLVVHESKYQNNQYLPYGIDQIIFMTE